MSRNGSGTYNLPAGNPVVTNTTITTTWANTTLTDIASALTGSLSSDGQTPATGPLNMASNRIISVTDPVNAQDAATKNYVDINTVNQSAVAITGGTIDNTTIGATTPAFGKFSELVVPAGTTGSRPATPQNGDIRYNTTTAQYEGFTTIPPVTTITTITYVTTTATATTAANHNMQTGDYVTITGCTPSAYNGSFSITVTGNNTFTYTMLTNPASNATVIGTYTDGVWTQIGGGATGNGGNQVFVLNDKSVTANYNIPSNKNASSTGPITVATGVIVSIPTGSRWVIL